MQEESGEVWVQEMKSGPEYNSYCGARDRCADLKNARYGGRGIKFLFTSFEQFLAEVGPKPSPRHMLDRENNDGHYEPDNVRWVTPKVSANNRKQTTGCSRPDLAEWNSNNLRGKPGHPQTVEA